MTRKKRTLKERIDRLHLEIAFSENPLDRVKARLELEKLNRKRLRNQEMDSELKRAKRRRNTGSVKNKARPGDRKRKWRCSSCGELQSVTKREATRAARLRCVRCGGPVNAPHEA